MTFHKPKAIREMANQLLSARPDASSAEVMKRAASMLSDISRSPASGGLAVELLQKVYNHGENFDLHERIRIFLHIED